MLETFSMPTPVGAAWSRSISVTWPPSPPPARSKWYKPQFGRHVTLHILFSTVDWSIHLSSLFCVTGFPGCSTFLDSRLENLHFLWNKAEYPSANPFPVLVVLVVKRRMVDVVVMVVDVMERFVETVEDAVGVDVQLCHLEILLLLSGSGMVGN